MRILRNLMISIIVINFCPIWSMQNPFKKIKELVNSSIHKDIDYSFDNDPNAQDNLNQELLIASKANNVNRIKFLISVGADVNCKNKYGQTPLELSFNHSKESANASRLLFNAGSFRYKNFRDYPHTIIYWSIEFGATDIAEYFIKKNKSFISDLIEEIILRVVKLKKHYEEELIKLNENNFPYFPNNYSSSWKDYLLEISEQEKRVNREKYRSEIQSKLYRCNRILAILIKLFPEKINYYMKSICKAVLDYHQADIIHALISISDLNSLKIIKDSINEQSKDIFYYISIEIYNAIKAREIKLNEEKEKLRTNLFNAIEAGNYKEVKNLAQKISMGIYDLDGNNPLLFAAKCNKLEIFKLILSIRPSLIIEKNKDNKNALQIWPTIANDLAINFNKNNKKNK